jgi:Insertion element 4 transposase N-terminal
VAGKAARWSDGKLPPHVMVYFAMALALFAEEDYGQVAARLTETLPSWAAGMSRGARRPQAGSPGPQAAGA